MLFVTIVFGLMGLGLLAMGRWGSRSSGTLSRVPGYDTVSIERRRATLHRGAFACYLAGAVFVLLAIAALIFQDDHLQCLPGPAPGGRCTAACAAAHQCPPAPVQR